jgi:membrane protease YdiL (CAAX protease family)
LDLGAFPIALMGVALLVPVLYSAAWKRESLKKTAALWALSVVIVILYPVVTYAFDIGGDFGYFLAKLAFFVLLPTVILMYLEKWRARTVLVNVGVRRKNLESSVAYGILASLVIIAVTVAIRLIMGSEAGDVNAGWSIAMFLDAFNEEFLFRGVFFLYLMTLIDWRVAAGTSVAAFVLAHSQYLNDPFIIATIVQAILLTWVAYRTRNIIGPWISHGLSRIVPQYIMAWM